MWSDRNTRYDQYRHGARDRNTRTEGRDRAEYGRDRPDWGSARSDYGRYAYGGRLDEQGGERYGRGRDDRGFLERTGDEVRSWFGDEEAERRRRMPLWSNPWKQVTAETRDTKNDKPEAP